MTRNPSRGVATVVVASAVVLCSPLASADPDRTGPEVVSAVCSQCHSTGKDGAPRIGNLDDWLPRMSHGVSNLADHAIRGYKKMPSHGKEPGVTDLEISRAVAFMINPRSAQYETRKPYNSAPAISGQVIYNAKCHECHAVGKYGAPRLDDPKNWLARMQQGVDKLAAHAAHGHKSMPSRGGMISLSDAEIRGAVVYMITTTVSNGVLAGLVPDGKQ